MEDLKNAAARFEISVECASRINFATAQNAVPVIRSIRILNNQDSEKANLTLSLHAQPPFLQEKQWKIDRIGANDDQEIRNPETLLDLSHLAGLNEAERGQLYFCLKLEDEVVAEQVVPVEVMARDEWGGVKEMAHILAAFVSPNDPAIPPLLKKAAALLGAAGHRSALDGYQSGDPARAYMLTASIWSAITGMGLTYAEPPKSFERMGQKVRAPTRIAAEGLATCFDTSLLFASALEAAGLNPVIIFTEGHAFAGVWLIDKTLPATIEPDVVELRKAISAHEFIPFETTFVTAQQPASFDRAVAEAKANLSEAKEAEFNQAVDIARARAAGVRPLASHHAAEVQQGLNATVDPAPLPKSPDFDRLPAELALDVPTTPDGRIERWQRKLLDLSLRNRLLNFSFTKQTIPFHCPDVPKLEDLLAEGKKFKVVSLTDENPIGDRDPEAYRKQHGKDIHDEFTRTSMERGQVCVPLSQQDMSKRLVTLFRKSKSDLAEGGTNTLFLAAGFLRWKKNEGDERTYRAPILLLPVALKRRSAQSDFYLSHHEDEIRINSTLFQFLERDFGLTIPSLQGKLPEDESGLDLPKIFEFMRQAVREVPGFEVVEDLALATFSFAKYLMWKDLVDRTDHLRKNRLVKHLIDNPETPFVGVDTDFPLPEEIDRRVAPKDLMLPLPADSSQISAVLAAAGGHDFVVVGPPGTGKSQTIGNMIAQCMALGKSVLFVAEKSAALDVVHRRLKHYGLADACLELHSNKADRRKVIAQLGAAWDRSAKRSNKAWIAVTSELQQHRDQLNAYVEALHKKGSHGFSVFEAIGIIADHESPYKLSFETWNAHDSESFSNLEALAEASGRTYLQVKDCHAFRSISFEDWSHAWQSELLILCGTLAQSTRGLAEKSKNLEQVLGVQPEADTSVIRAALLAKFSRAAASTAMRDFRVVLDPEFDDLAASLTALENAIGAIREAQAKLSGSYSNSEIPRIPIEQMDQDWRKAGTKFWPMSALARRKVRKLLQSYTQSGKSDPATELSPLRIIQESLQLVEQSKLSSLPVFGGLETDLAAMQGYLEDALALRDAIAALKRIAIDEAALSATLAPLLEEHGDKDPVAKAAQEFLEAFAGFEKVQGEYVSNAGKKPCGETLASIQSELAEIKSMASHISDWSKWVKVKRQAIHRGLKPLIDSLEAGKVIAPAQAFKGAYFSWWLPLALDQSKELREFSHWEQANLISKFQKLAGDAQKLAANEVRQGVYHDLPARDGVARKSELGVLRHQLGLQRPSISIRNLIGSMPETITKLAPCVLMSPLSVAQYLPTDHALFDMVIFDEASQITTWDAVGSIARGKQSIIVGDPKQLPPMNFFGRANDDEEDLEIYERDLASILDEASAAGLPNLQLNWHYRSRDEALIAFSNHHYYGNRLVTFPSPSTDSDALQFHKIEGVYARGSGATNVVEAKAISEFAVQRLKAWLQLPEEKRPTLGVITFNIHQQELILDLLDAARREFPELEWFFDDDREEPLIVKNLENIQGDERDTMLFSITFGPDVAGKITMNFGAINSDGGEKRLNVAITRARAELHIFSSITADEIDLSRTKARGVADLKNFIDYAARGAIALPAADKGSLGPAENPFEEAIAAALEAKGWEVRTQIGVSGFRIDLGIVHPQRAGSFLAGVECDGATYHSSASARDRDKIREGVLRNLGWEILRIWSTDWFRNPQETINRTDQVLREILAASLEEGLPIDPVVAEQNVNGIGESGISGNGPSLND
jgi:very-short-patch-repair endonuclease